MKRTIGMLLMCLSFQAVADSSVDEANALVLRVKGAVNTDRAFVKSDDGVTAGGVGLLIPVNDLYGESGQLTIAGKAALDAVEAFSQSSHMAYTVFLPEDGRNGFHRIMSEAAPRGRVISTMLLEGHVYIVIRN